MLLRTYGHRQAYGALPADLRCNGETEVPLPFFQRRK